MGFEFNNEENCNMAKKELDYTMHINENLNNLNSEKTLELYNKLIDDKLFKTSVGMEFLRKLQKKLFNDKTIDNSKIKNIPAIIYTEESTDASDKSNRRDRKNSGNSSNNNINNSNVSNNKSSNSSNNKKNTVSGDNKKKNTGTSSSGSKGKNNKYKDLYIKMLIINLALVITIVVMFVITKRADKFDEDYYRESIENDYVSWQKALEEKESSIAAKENAS